MLLNQTRISKKQTVKEVTYPMDDLMVKKRNGRIKRSGCHLRSECKAKSNQRYFKKLLARDWDQMVITRDSTTGEYRLTTV